MRIIAGSKRGIKLMSPKNFDIRPTEDRVKENVFNLLGQSFNGAKILDLFSGTGAIGLEFLSRGAKEAYFVDKSKNAIENIKENIEKTKLKDNSNVLYMDYQVALNNLKGNKFDYIYIDPPFKDSILYTNAIKIILEKNMLSENGYIITEQNEENFIDLNLILENVKSRKYGKILIGIWKK